jgi:hypothetical protein
MDELYAVFLSWAVVLTGHAVPDHKPSVQIVSPTFLQAAACNGRPHCKVMGWFPPGETIYLDERLDFEHDLLASSVVVHEMVHYLQHQSGKYRAPYSCEDFLAMEREAYQAQRDFLLRYGTYYPVGVSMHHAGCQDAVEPRASPRIGSAPAADPAHIPPASGLSPDETRA